MKGSIVIPCQGGNLFVMVKSLHSTSFYNRIEKEQSSVKYRVIPPFFFPPPPCLTSIGEDCHTVFLPQTNSSCQGGLGWFWNMCFSSSSSSHLHLPPPPPPSPCPTSSPEVSKVHCSTRESVGRSCALPPVPPVPTTSSLQPEVRGEEDT